MWTFYALCSIVLLVGCEGINFVRQKGADLEWGPLECDSRDFKHDRFDGEPFDIKPFEEADLIAISEKDDKFHLLIRLKDDSPFQLFMGNWSCGANEWVVVGRPYISRLGKPIDDHHHRNSLAVMEEEKVMLGCQGYYFGEDEPEFFWNVVAEEGSEKPNITHRWELIKEEPKGNLFTSTWKLIDGAGIMMSDRANYTCEMRSASGNSIRGILLRVKGKLAALWPFLGICLEVIILCLGIFIYERRTKPKASSEDEAPTDGEVVVGGADEKGDEVRKRAPVKT